MRALLAALLFVALGSCGCGSVAPVAKVTPASPAVAKRLLKRQLDAAQLDYTWVACVRVDRTYQHVPITRCNVDFGIDPHVEAYCVLLVGGRLQTNHANPAIPCRHDDAGWNRTTVTS
ncbi:MAG TPA: hypothetical protein VE985_00180 [Gaiellaceae bacterium]|nr:hypothetical protein [Gaiellaceae bacterium]